MSQSFLNEAFKELALLNEDAFKLDADGVEAMQDFLDADEFDNSVEVIDPEAEDEEDVEGSYVGKVILRCNICQTLLYKSPEDVELNDDGTVANEGEECPYCYSTDGFTVIGQVAPFSFDDEEVEVSVEEKEEEDSEDEKDEEEGKEAEEVEDSIEIETTGKKGMEAAEAAMDTFEKDEDDSDKKDESLTESCEGKECKDESCEGSECKDEDCKGKECDEECKTCDECNESASEEVSEEPITEDLTEYKRAVKVTDGSKNDNGEEESWYIYANTDTELNDKIAEHNRNNSGKQWRKVGNVLNVVGGKVQESLESVDLETEEEVIHIKSEKKDSDVGADTIVPLEQETVDTIEAANEEEPEEDMEIADDFAVEDIEEEPTEEEEGEEVEADFDNFDEESFDGLGESFLKETYDNVDSFKTTNVAINPDHSKIVVEGKIKFHSGNEKLTQFIFEAKDITKEGKAKFIGENRQLSRGKKAFTMVGTLSEGKFLSESLNYNYRVKGQRVYGTVKNNK